MHPFHPEADLIFLLSGQKHPAKARAIRCHAQKTVQINQRHRIAKASEIAFQPGNNFVTGTISMGGCKMQVTCDKGTATTRPA